METAMNIQLAEDAYTDLCRTVGPLWGEKQEEQLDALHARLASLYAQHAVPNDDRLSGFES